MQAIFFVANLSLAQTQGLFLVYSSQSRLSTLHYHLGILSLFILFSPIIFHLFLLG